MAAIAALVAGMAGDGAAATTDPLPGVAAGAVVTGGGTGVARKAAVVAAAGEGRAAAVTGVGAGLGDGRGVGAGAATATAVAGRIMTVAGTPKGYAALRCASMAED